jgi:hypothetical protein
METRGEQTSIDRAGDIGAGFDGDDDRDVEHVGHVTGREAALRFGDEDDPVGPRSARQEARQGDIARSSQHDVVLCACGALGGARDG